jgi:hypothetical protein
LDAVSVLAQTDLKQPAHARFVFNNKDVCHDRFSISRSPLVVAGFL